MGGFTNATRVQISGLKGAPELNGKEGTVAGDHDGSGRITVNVDGSLGQKNLNPQNLSKVVKGGVFFPVGTRVKISGLKGAAHLNDKEGNILGKDEATGRYFVNVHGEGQKNLQGVNLSKASSGVKAAPKAAPNKDLAPELREAGWGIGFHVRVGGLNGAKELNGKVGVIFGYDKEVQRYVLEFEGLGQRKIKKENMVPMNVSSGFLSSKARMMSECVVAQEPPSKRPRTA
jgi:hypothetical protein